VTMVLVLDFGSQYTQLIARRVREAHVYCQVHPFDLSIERIKELDPRAVILSGGPASVYDSDAPNVDRLLDQLDIPVLGICYGMGLLAAHAGGRVVRSSHREYGNAELEVDEGDDLFHDVGGINERQVWMSHGDRLEKLPEAWQVIGHTKNSPLAAIRDRRRPRYGLQFHPEVVHSKPGRQIIENFLFRVCALEADWTMESFVEAATDRIREQVGHGQVICGISGGVDSTVTAALIERAIPGQLCCVFVDNGLLRLNEAAEVEAALRPVFGDDLITIDASARFLDALAGEFDPENKRKIIGKTFIEVFESVASGSHRGRPSATFLGQGTCTQT